MRTIPDSDRAPDLRYILTAVSALDNLRSEAGRIEVAYLSRLEGFAAAYVAGTGAPSAPHPPRRRTAAVVAWVARRTRGILRMAGNVSAVRSSVVRARKIATMATSEAGTPLIVALASNRLPIDGQPISLRHHLGMLARSLDDSVPHLVTKIRSARRILLFDPLPFSTLGKHSHKACTDEFLILDGASLLTLFVRSLLAAPLRNGRIAVRACRLCYSVLKAESRLTARTLCRALLSTIITLAYSDLLGPFRETEAVFFTCNSMLSEILRAYLIQSPACREIDEVMHGIGSIPSERYFAEILSAGRDVGAYQKHFFIPQIPNLPLHGVFRQQARFGPAAAINAYLNHHLLDLQHLYALNEQIFEDRLGAIRPKGPWASKPTIITIFGNYPSDGKLFDSVSFQFERLLIQRIRQVEETLEADYRVIYVPHPTYGLNELTHPTFADHRVHVLWNAVFAWLVSDACVAINSSAAFEAAYFGVPGWLPLTSDDGFYTQSYLSLLSHPQSTSLQDVLGGFDRFLAACTRRPSEDLSSRIRRRLTLMGHQACAAEPAPMESV